MTAQELLKKYGQAHLLRCVEQLSDGEKEAFLSAIKEIDFQVVDSKLFLLLFCSLITNDGFLWV